MRLHHVIPIVVLTATIVAGCSRTSPATGTWSGTVQVSQPKNSTGPLGAAGFLLGMSLNGPCRLTLKPDGTGFFKMSIAPERPVLWTQEDNKVILRNRYEEKAPSNQPKPDAQNSTLVGTLSDDQQTMVLDLGIVQATLKKQPDSNK
jgi:hypothetical protein